MLDRVHAKAIDVRLTDPVVVYGDQGIDDPGADLVVVVGEILQRTDVAQLVFGGVIVIADLAAAVIELRIAQLLWNRPIRPPPEPEVEPTGD